MKIESFENGVKGDKFGKTENIEKQASFCLPEKQNKKYCKKLNQGKLKK